MPVLLTRRPPGRVGGLTPAEAPVLRNVIRTLVEAAVAAALFSAAFIVLSLLVHGHVRWK